jgi:hypothetical protein
VFLLVLPIFGWTLMDVRGKVETTVYVDPVRSIASPGNLFTVDVRISGVKGLWAYEFKLMWDPALLNATKVTEGPFLSAEGAHRTFFNRKIYNEPDPKNVSGYVYVTCTLMGEPATAAASGSGVLATVEFLVEKEGQTPLNLADTVLLDAAPTPKEIPHITEDGVFQCSPLPPAEISIYPLRIIDPSLSPGKSFNVSVVIARVEKLYAWSLNMSWQPTLLNVTEIEEGSFLKQEGAYTTFGTQIFQEEGYLYANCTLIGESDAVSASGNGTLFTVTFLVEAGGITNLHFYDIVLLDYEGAEIFYEAKDGYFSNALRDVAIVGVEASPNRARVGDYVSITITAKNKGECIESFDVIVYYNDNSMGTLHISDLGFDAEKTLTFSWSTKYVAEGEYAIKVVAKPLDGETNTEDNTFVYNYVTVTPPESTDQSFQFMLIIVAVIAVIIAVAIVFMKKR